MKTLKTLATALLIVLSASAFANDKKKSERFLMDYTIRKFIDAVSHGQLKGIAGIFDENVKMTTTLHNKIVRYEKAEILTLLGYAKNVDQNCKTEYQMLERTPTQALAKICQKYEGFTRTNLLSLANTNDGWKITNISSSID